MSFGIPDTFTDSKLFAFYGPPGSYFENQGSPQIDRRDSTGIDSLKRPIPELGDAPLGMAESANRTRSGSDPTTPIGHKAIPTYVPAARPTMYSASSSASSLSSASSSNLVSNLTSKNESRSLPARRPRSYSVDFLTEKVYPSPNASQPTTPYEESAIAIQKRKEADQKLHEWGTFVHKQHSSTTDKADIETEPLETTAEFDDYDDDASFLAPRFFLRESPADSADISNSEEGGAVW